MHHRVPSRPRLSRGPLAAVLLVLLSLVTACGSGNSGAAGVPIQGGEPDAAVAGVRAPSDVAGGTLRVLSAQVDSLDPQRSYVPGVWNLMRLYARTLVTYSAQPGHTDELVPDLATDLGRTTDGGKTWTFTLRDGVRFETGMPITSRDVKYGIERSFASDVIVGGPTYVVDLLDNRNDQYAGPYQDESKGHLGLASVATPDDHTIVFTLNSPTPDFPFVMALPSSSPVPAAADTRAAYGGNPVSSGPYAVTSVDGQTGTIVLDRNPQWDRATDGVRTALPDQVVVRTGLSGLARDQALLAGSADVDLSGTGVQPATTSRVAEAGFGSRMDDVTTGAMRLLALPTTVAPMNNVDCRAAVADVVDRSAVQEALQGEGNAVRTSQLWPRALTGAPPDPDLHPDLEAARAALARCGKPQGFSTVLAVADVPSSVLVARSIAADLAKVGIQAEIRPLDPTTYYANDVGRPDTVTKQGYGIVLATRTADFPTAASFLVPLVDGRLIRSVGNINYARLSDPAVNAAVDKARAATERAAATDAWHQVLTAVAATSAYVPLAENRVQLLAGQRLRNGVVMQPYAAYDLATAGVG
jgi:peptide/nickel transport system substrate-binding protein